MHAPAAVDGQRRAGDVTRRIGDLLLAQGWGEHWRHSAIVGRRQPAVNIKRRCSRCRCRRPAIVLRVRKRRTPRRLRQVPRDLDVGLGFPVDAVGRGFKIPTSSPHIHVKQRGAGNAIGIDFADRDRLVGP